MPVIAISAINTATDTITATAHGLLTGDRTRVRSVGGTLAAPLAPVTDVFAIRLTADTLKLATTNSLALAGTAIDITTAGTGAQTLEYGLPFCVPRIAAPLTQQFSADSNATWNALVALYDLLTGQAQSVFPSSSLKTYQVPLGVAQLTNAPVTPELDTSGASGRLIQLPGLQVGAIITSLSAKIADSAIGPTSVFLQLMGWTGTSAVTGVASGPPSAGTGAIQTIGAGPYTMTVVAGSTYWAFLGVNSGTATCKLYSLEYTAIVPLP